MKPLLIKIGKSWNVIKREGIFHGGKRVLIFIVNFAKTILKPKRGDVLFITAGVGDVTRYRVINYSEELNTHGTKSDFTMVDDPFLLRYADKFKIFILQRLSMSSKLEKFIEKVKLQNKEIIFETDDLVFDPFYLHQTDSYKKMNALEKMQYKNGIGGEILKDPYVKVCTTTTSFLAEKLRSYGKKVFIVRNKLTLHDIEICDNLLKTPKKKDGKIRIGYFSGTFGHNADFASVTPALLEIMEKYPQVELFIVGPLDIDSQLNKFKDRVKQLHYVPWEKHLANKYSVDIDIAPLVIGDPFCEGKSELKFFEAGMVKNPCVAVRNQTFSEAITDGVDGFLASNTDEWVEKLSKLIESENLRREIGEKAREKALADYTTKNSHENEYYEYLKKRIREIK